MRVKPSLWKGLLILVGYLAVVFTVWLATGTKYDEVGDTVDNVRKTVTLAMALGAIYVVIVTSVLGWWKPALREPRRAAHHKWMWIIPALLLVGAVLNLAATKWGRLDDLGTPLGTYVAWLAIGCVMVGFNEEMITRGLLIVGARGTLHEGWVWFVSSLCFGLLHVPNAFFGQSVKDTAQQVFFAFGIGTAYYVTRRISGALVVTMILHGAWDFSVFLQGHSVEGLADKPVGLGGIVMGPVVLLSLIAIWRLHHDEGDVVEPGADQLAAFTEAGVGSPTVQA
jgi:membrane protease YdiL (CAAX protease family)